jgi:hypothetical protein
MTVAGITPVLPVPSLDEAVAYWTVVLGVEPTFIDGDRWAQFDIGPRRLALAGRDRASDQAAIMVKVANLEQAGEKLAAHGVTLGPTEHGLHEDRRAATAPGGWTLILYCPRGD